MLGLVLALNQARPGWIKHVPLSSGDKLGPCEMLAPLGAGGMVEVYSVAKRGSSAR